MRKSTTTTHIHHHVSAPGMDLAGHLYDSFLHGYTADVILRVAGTWCAIYRLHRVVLIQAGFFRTLFTSDFEEAKSEKKEIDLVFDDTNITRAAFEFCIGRLYGGGPPLYIYPELTSSPTKPLTPVFPFSPPITSTAPDKHQPASPRFLLSLLATSLYLEIPSIASHALSSVLATVGPYTVIDYMNFARGKPILANVPDTPAVGLEHVAEIISYHSEAGDSISLETASISSISVQGGARTCLPFYYGAISDKIGEACACWLARWGQDMFAYEEANASSPSQPTSRRRADTVPSDHFGLHDVSPVVPPIFTSFRPGHGLPPRWIRALISSDSFFVADEVARYTFAKRVVELRRTLRRNAGAPNVSVKGKGRETQQHGFVELSSEEDEEREWIGLFEDGIYYANMTPADLIAISTDISPSTNRPYVPLHVLQTANWEHTRLRHIISASLNSSGTNEKEKKDLGIGITGADIHVAQMHAVPNPGHPVHQQFFLVPHDQSLRVGDTINTSGSALAEGNVHNNISMDQLFQQSFSPHARTASASNSGTVKNNEELPTTSNERTFFGLLPDTLDTLLRHSPSSLHNEDDEKQTEVHSAFSSKRIYTTQPPFRFSIEFWDLDLLKEKQRLYSQTVWYAGSLFNVYVQVAKKKESTSGGDRNKYRDRERTKECVGSEMQLGIYLHRQSTVESIPPKSAPSPGVVLPQEVRFRDGFDPDAPEVAELREGESVLIGMAPLQSVRSNSPQAVDSSSRRDNASSSGWLRAHARGPSLPLGLGSGGNGNGGGSGGVPQSPQRSGTPLSLGLTRSRTPVNNNNNTNSTRARPGTGSSSSGSTGVGALSSSLPNETLNMQLVPPNPSWVNTEPASAPNSPVVGQTSPSRVMAMTTLNNSNNNGSGGPSALVLRTSSSPPYTVSSSPPAQQPYRDPRQVISVYFSVYCASATGSRQTRFRSGPDVFKIGQSWGWKSGGLLGTAAAASSGNNESAQIISAKEDGGLTSTGKESSFRATVILGVV
ncbi:hypothetical protein E1B28_013561 [Marasmius oreades]|uniref:BTB domain-containing protein n=1 Tax=Marasmius oreades TaxID=181124 RepID=A0A9P7RQ24_9AGAR|nr:uncharacterized protein E1B28_013561 [Marasmius oreades]KAG7087612.1 hypothetical protein E1B28_013561 [Marasmius oreades]